MLRPFLLLAGVALSQLGCAEQLQLLDRGPTGGVSPCSFWPPPAGSSTWVVGRGEAAGDESLGTVADELALGLRGAGYAEQRWYPVGAGNSHGFAVTTRLEQVEDGAGERTRERWSSLYADATTLRWLQQAQTPSLPRPGRYRVLLVSYSDLPIGPTSTAQRWNDETIMDWPNAAERPSPQARDMPARALSDYRLGVYEYDYVWDEREGRGKLLPADGNLATGTPRAPTSLVRALGMAALEGSQKF